MSFDAVAVANLTKTYRAGVGRARVREMLPPPIDAGVRGLFPTWWRRDTFNALEDVSFTLSHGDSLGVIGHNGAGKTTLLKLIAGVTSPTAGSVKVEGRVAALLDVLVGFHPELTGRENVYLLGAMEGYGRREMTHRIPEVFAFAEIGDMVDTPVKRFSSGMMSRLAFATLTVLELDVLLVDEVLAVGDASFQRKCVEWLGGFRAGGGSLVLVSHNLGLIRSMANRAITIDRGHVVDSGVAPEVTQRYARSMERRDSTTSRDVRGEAGKTMQRFGQHRWGAGDALIGSVSIEEPDDGHTLRLVLTLSSDRLEEALVCAVFLDDAGHDVAAAMSPPVSFSAATRTVTCEIDSTSLRPGVYFPVIAALSLDGRVQDRWQLDRGLVLGDGLIAEREGLGAVRIEGEWVVTSSRPSAGSASRVSLGVGEEPARG